VEGNWIITWFGPVIASGNTGAAGIMALGLNKSFEDIPSLSIWNLMYDLGTVFVNVIRLLAQH
jgi:hypothetical protein